MAESRTAKNARDGRIRIINNTRTYEVAVEQGNMQIQGANEGNYETAVIEDRGEYQGERRTKRKYPTFTWTAVMRDLVDGTDPTLVGMCLRKGVHATDEGVSGPNAEVYHVDVEWQVDGVTHGDPSNHTQLLETCRIESVDFTEAEDKNIVTISGVVREGITYT